MKADIIKPLLLKLISYKVSVPRARHASCRCCVKIRVQRNLRRNLRAVKDAHADAALGVF